MKEWFWSRAPRERVILVAGAVTVALIVFWALVWQPLRSGSLELRQSVAQKSRLLVDVQRAAALAPSGDNAARRNSSQSLISLIDSTAQSHGVKDALTRTRPDGADGINVTFQSASFDSLLSWLVALQTNYDIAVESASFNGTRATGLVNGQIFLRRS